MGRYTTIKEVFMSSISEYTAKVHEYMDATDKVIAAKNKEIERLEDIVLKSDLLIKALKEMLCRSIEGELSEEAQKEILAKFRN